MKRTTALTTLAALCLAGSLRAETVPEVEAREPRAFGYQVGDLVQRGVVVHAPDGWALDADSLPKPGARGQPLELRSITRSERHEDGGVRHELQLQYQVFFAPTGVRIFELPAVRLLLHGPGRDAPLRVDAWPIAVAPLGPPEVSSRRGLGELQPDREPFTIDLWPGQRALRLLLLLAAAALLTLLVVHAGLPWLDRRRRPFAMAHAALRRLRPSVDAAQWREACLHLHRALDRTAGAVVFERGLAQFVAQRPAFAPLQVDLTRFLQLSRREFFAEASREPAAASWLVELSRQCRDAERNT